MWNWLNCYLSGNHDFGVSCGSGSMFLRCIHCGKRSNGWSVHNEPQVLLSAPLKRQAPPAIAALGLPFVPPAAVQQQQQRSA